MKNKNSKITENWEIILPQQDCPYWENELCCKSIEIPYFHCTYKNCPNRKKTEHEVLVEKFRNSVSDNGEWVPHFKDKVKE